MKTKFIVIVALILIVGVVAFVVLNKKPEDKKPEAKTEIVSIDYEKYQLLRSKVYENETYAILIWNSTQEPCVEYYMEIEEAFKGRKAKVYAIDTNEISKEDKSRIIDDVTIVMKYKSPTLIEPTLFIMSKGKVIYQKENLMYRHEIMEILDEKGIE